MLSTIEKVLKLKDIDIKLVRTYQQKRIAEGVCVCQLDLAHFDALIWPTPRASIVVL